MTDIDKTKEMLEEAEQALHTLMTSGGTVEVTYPGGQKIKFSEVNVTQLRSYINMLKQQIMEAEGVSARRPIRFGF